LKFIKREFFKDEKLFADKTLCEENVFGIADGMGVRGTGKIAAEIAINTVKEFIPIKTAYDVERVFKEANRRIIKEITKYGDDLMCGTTLSILILEEDKFLIGHVGDSRIYLLRGENIELLTVDQVEFKKGKKYINALGTVWKPEVYLKEGGLYKGDIFLLISDGIVNFLSEGELKHLIDYDMESSAERIIGKYKEYSSGDDLSLILVYL